MAKSLGLTDEQVLAEIARLRQSPAVKAAQKEMRERTRLRQQLYTLRYMEKRGNELLSTKD